MPRPKSFDPEHALSKAIELFRMRGYSATFMHEIAQYVGVSRSSLYATFGGKRALFVQALRHDCQVHREAGLRNLETAAAPRQAIIDLFESAAAADGGDTAPPHVLVLISTAIELLPDDREVAAVVREELAALEAGIRDAVERGIAGGEIARQVDATQAARTVLSLFLGTRLLMRNKPVLRAVADQVRTLLPAP